MAACQLTPSLTLPRGLGVSAAKLPAPDIVRRRTSVDRAARRPSELGQKLGPASEAQCHHQRATSR